MRTLSNLLTREPPVTPTATIASSPSTVGGAVRTLDRSYQTMSRRRDDLTNQIAALTEELRQTTVVVHSLEAAMTIVCADPALTAAERDIAETAVASRIEGAIDVEDFAHVG